MTDTLRASTPLPTAESSRPTALWAIADVFTIARRDLMAIIRIPVALVFIFIQPIMFVLLFRYVFGGVVHVQGENYVNFLLPGILTQAMIFGAVNTAIGLSEDLQKGLIERFRALPMARMAVLAGRTVADMARNIIVLILITGVGFLVGFRPTGSAWTYLQASVVMLLFAYCLSWGFAYVGLSAPNSEAAQAITFPIIFPLTFASAVFVPVSSMPSWLQVFANNQPVSQVTFAVRGLMLGQAHGNSTWISLAWSFGIIAVLAPLAVNRYRRVA
jgi:ABC transporter DrrB family efflux protein